MESRCIANIALADLVARKELCKVKSSLVPVIASPTRMVSIRVTANGQTKVSIMKKGYQLHQERWGNRSIIGHVEGGQHNNAGLTPPPGLKKNSS